MCLAVPAEVIEINEDLAIVEVNGNTLQVSIVLIPKVNIGDFVLIHAGYALERIDAAEAKETLKLLEEFHEATAE